MPALVEYHRSLLEGRSCGIRSPNREVIRSTMLGDSGKSIDVSFRLSNDDRSDEYAVALNFVIDLFLGEAPPAHVIPAFHEAADIIV